MAKKLNPNFEQSLQELQNLVEQMESGSLSLEDSLQAFERGIKLTRDCQTALEQAEQRVTLLLEKNNAVIETVFEVPEE